MLGDALVSARQALGGVGNNRPSTRSRDPFANSNHANGNGGIPSLTTLLPKFPTALSSSSSATASASYHGAPDSPASSLAALLPSSSTLGFISLCCLWYLSSAFSSNTGKSILTRFRYPVTLTFVQFAFVAGYCVVILALRERIGAAASHHHQHHPVTSNGAANGGLSNRRRRSSISTLGGWGIRKPSKHMFHGTLMMSLFQIAGHVFSSMAIARVPVSTVHTIKALSPLFTVLSYAALFGVRYSSATYVALLPLTVGVMLACSFDLRANAMGFLCALGSTFIFVAQNIFSKKLLPKENSSVASGELKTSTGPGGAGGGAGSGGAAKLDKLNLLFYSSGMAFFLMIPIWLYSDASALFFSSPNSNQQPAGSTSSLVFYFFANGSVHFAQNLLAFSILARTSPVTYSIASLIKRIAVICIAIVWSGQHVSLIQAVGMTSTFGGLWMYNRAKSDVDKGEKKRVQVEKRHDLELPSTVGDARALDGTDTPPLQQTLSDQARLQLYSRREGNGAAFVSGPSAAGVNGLATSSAFTSSAAHHPAAAAPPPPRTHQGVLPQPSPTVYAPIKPFQRADHRSPEAVPPSSVVDQPRIGSSPLGLDASPPSDGSARPSDPRIEPYGSGRHSNFYARDESPASPRPNGFVHGRDGAASARGGFDDSGARNRRGSGSSSRSRVSDPSASAKSVGGADSQASHASPGVTVAASKNSAAIAAASSAPRGYAGANGTSAASGRIMPVPNSLFTPIAAGGGSAASGGYR
ncbi:hypothetical protein JCM10908_004812 [Rhodotorula pacifica]|uniref:uncharacterized protein n=1 Tax=Rhodotorula pacifica TaxID=1495444 RepID=UPI00317AECD9